MALVNMDKMLQSALQGKYAVGAFNILDYNSMKAVIQAADSVKSPIIVQTSAKTVKFWGAKTMMGWTREIAASVQIPVAIHLDHCTDIRMIETCIDAGWTSVMIDASSKPFEENLALTRQVVAMAKPKGISVEAELGTIGGVEDDIHVKGEDAHLADPDLSERFCKELGLSCFAPAIGTAHGVYKGEPKIAFDRLETIAKRTKIPIALHGGTGLSEQVFRKCISLGAAKVNISTHLKYTFIDSFIGYHQVHAKDYEPLKVLGAQHEAIVREVLPFLKLYGSENKA